ncbi:hypothetical protein [Tahibacter aquaticus]|uniref:hypothetical protein n=1 Tax=Tahibacter aquaticus TaxID=520092 RepID=UPI00105C58A4|nr:hypothetical protein [Tahibacter aquaticus]
MLDGEAQPFKNGYHATMTTLLDAQEGEMTLLRIYFICICSPPLQPLSVRHATFSAVMKVVGNVHGNLAVRSEFVLEHEFARRFE